MSLRRLHVTADRVVRRRTTGDRGGASMYSTYRKPVPTGSNRRRRQARLSVFAVFATAGFLVGVWSGVIPQVAQRTHVSAGLLGILILISSIGIVAGAQLGGRLQTRMGSAGLCLTGLGTAAFGAFVMGQSGDAAVLCAAMTVFTFGMGLNDVGMNLQAVTVEREYRRPIMAAFHAFFSLGGGLGALAVLGAATIGWSAPVVLLVAALIAAVSVSVASGWLVRPAEEHRPVAVVASRHPSSNALPRVATGPAGWPDEEYATPRSEVKPRRPRVRMTRVAWMLGLCALVLMFAEGVATDWSALQLTQAFGAAAGASAFGYAVFAVTMTGGRLVVDRVAAAVGPVAVVRGGSLIAAGGLGVILVSPSIWLTLAGWAALGAGLCGCVPQVFTAAGAQPDAGVVLSRVLTLGYVGIFGGPALIGLLAGATSVTVALVAPFVLLLVPVWLAGAVRRPARAAGAGAGRDRDQGQGRVGAEPSSAQE
ncbi:MAG: MFS transporter [Humibacter sp.]